MNIILIGMRGSGKTTISRLLSKKLGYKLVGTDELIESRAGMPIRIIIEKFGWEKFREYEKNIITSISKVSETIIDTGGGVVTNQKNVNILKKMGVIIWLVADIKSLEERIKNDKNRPMLTGAKSIYADLVNVYNQRKNLYEETADYIIRTDDKTPKQTVENIINFIDLNNDDRHQN